MFPSELIHFANQRNGLRKAQSSDYSDEDEERRGWGFGNPQSSIRNPQLAMLGGWAESVIFNPASAFGLRRDRSVIRN